MDLTVSEIKKNGAVLKWSGDSGDVVLKKKVTITCDFAEKESGNDITNPHNFKGGSAFSLLAPSSTIFVEHSQNAYNDIATLDGKVSTSVSSANNSILQRLLTYKVIEAIKRYDSNYFSDRGATTLAEEVAVARSEITKVVSSVWGYGSGASTAGLVSRIWTGANWDLQQWNTTTEIKELRIETTDATSVIRDSGNVFVQMNAGASDGTTNSSASVDFAKLEIEFNVFETIENVSSPYMLENLKSNTEYTLKVVNEGGESDEVTFKTKELIHIEKTFTLDFKAKTAGNDEVNPNSIFRFNTSQNLASIEETQGAENADDGQYEALETKNDGLLMSETVADNSLRIQTVSRFNLLETVNRESPEIFELFNATTIPEKVDVLRSCVTNITPLTAGYARFTNTSAIYTTRMYDAANNSIQVGQNTSGALNDITASYTTNTARFIQNDGHIIVNNFTVQNSSTVTSYIDYVKVDVTIKATEED